MPGIQIVRGAAATQMRRGDIPQGAVFAVKNPRTGRLGTSYAAIGANGRLYSVNLSNGALASCSNRGGMATLTGKFVFETTELLRYGQREVLRRSVAPGEVFTVRGGTKKYLHMGRIHRDRNGWLSIPVANQDNHAVAENGDSHVIVVGTFKIKVTPTK